MKVFYITMAFPHPSETFACNDVRELRKKGIDVSVHSMRPAHKNTQKMLTERNLGDIYLTHGSIHALRSGLKIALLRPALLFTLLFAIFYYCWRNPSHVLKSLMLVPRTLDLFSAVEQAQPDIVHIYWGHYPSLVGFLVQRYLPKTVTTISLAAYDLAMQYGLTLPVAKRANGVRTLAKVNVPEISSIYNIPQEKIVIIHDGIDLSRLRYIRSATKEKFAKRILTAGRLIAQKGMYDVLEVFRSVYETHPETTLTILGDGPERKRLEAYCVEYGLGHAVTFLGHVSHDDVFREMTKSEYFLFLSKSERLPNVIKEAMACGCICVTTQTIGIEELIPSASFGYVVPIDDREKAIQSMLAALNLSPLAKNAMAQRAQNYINDNFDITASIDTYLRLWQRLTSSCHTPSVEFAAE
jgi:colanic acid/amylovoran biosynthesis glycosyltransferase